MRRIHASSSTTRMRVGGICTQGSIVCSSAMMTFFTEDHDLFRKSFREFVERELRPHTDEWERAESFPRDVFRRMGELGYFGMSYPEELGGGGGDYWYNVAYGEELVRSGSAGLNMSLMVQSDMATPVINAIGHREQKEEFLAPAIRGEKIAALAAPAPNPAPAAPARPPRPPQLPAPPPGPPS